MLVIQNHYFLQKNRVNSPVVATLTDLCLRHKLFHLAWTSLMNNKTLRAGDLDCNKIFALAHAKPSPLLMNAIWEVIGSSEGLLPYNKTELRITYFDFVDVLALAGFEFVIFNLSNFNSTFT